MVTLGRNFCVRCQLCSFLPGELKVQHRIVRFARGHPSLLFKFLMPEWRISRPNLDDNATAAKVCYLPSLLGDRAVHARSPAPVSGVSVGHFSTIQPRLKPVQHLAFNPSHPVGAKLYPLGEMTSLFQTCDVLR